MKQYRDSNWLRQKYWDEGLTLAEIGNLMGVCRNTIFKWMKRFNIPRRGSASRFQGGERSLETRRKMSEAFKGKNHRLWKGGRFKDTDGYILIHNPKHPCARGDGYILEHRLVMMEELGRYLESYEIVHHRNGIKDDNRVENLELFPHANQHNILTVITNEHIKRLESELNVQSQKTKNWMEAYFRVLVGV